MPDEPTYPPQTRVILTPEGYESIRETYGRYYDGELPQPGDKGTVVAEHHSGVCYVEFDGRENPKDDHGFLVGHGDVITPDELVGDRDRAFQEVQRLLAARPVLQRLTRAQLVEVTVLLFQKLLAAHFMLQIDPVALGEVIQQARQNAPRRKRAARSRHTRGGVPDASTSR